MDTFLNDIGDVFPPALAVVFISILPFFELRLAIPLGISLDLKVYEAFIYAYIGSMIPAFFIIYFIRKVFNYLKGFKVLKSTIKRLIIKSNLKYENLMKYKMLGLYFFVAIPLPGTGVWSASLISDVANLDKKLSLLAIALGNLTSGLIVLSLSHLAFN